VNFDNYSQSIDAGILITTNLITLNEVKHRQIKQCHEIRKKYMYNNKRSYNMNFNKEKVIKT